MKVVIAGGSGQVGTVLARAMHAVGHEVVVLSRRPVTLRWRMVSWDAGFAFEFPVWPEAAVDLCRRWRAMRGCQAANSRR